MKGMPWLLKSRLPSEFELPFHQIYHLIGADALSGVLCIIVATTGLFLLRQRKTASEWLNLTLGRFLLPKGFSCDASDMKRLTRLRFDFLAIMILNCETIST